MRSGAVCQTLDETSASCPLGHAQVCHRPLSRGTHILLKPYVASMSSQVLLKTNTGNVGLELVGDTKDKA